MTEYKLVSKTLGDRLQELFQSLQVIRDSLTAVREGKLYQVIPLYGQMRALLAEKSKHNKPLLVDLASILGREPKLYCFPGVDEDSFPKLEAELLLRVGGLPVSVYQEVPSQKLLNLSEFLSQKIVVLKGRTYSRHDIIKYLAEKAGGAHYPAIIPEDLAFMLSVGINGQPALQNALVQMAQAVFDLSVRVVREIADFEIHMLIVIPPQPLQQPKFILDAVYPNTHMRFYLALDAHRRPIFGVRGIDGALAEVSTAPLVDWSAPRHVSLGVRTENDLRTTLTIGIDGEELGSAQAPRPIFAMGDLTQYRRYFNRSEAAEDTGLIVGMFNLFMASGTADLKAKCAIREYIGKQIENGEEPCALFMPGSYGLTKQHESTMEMSGNVRMVPMSRVLKGQYDD